jgi:hypothetical protein
MYLDRFSALIHVYLDKVETTNLGQGVANICEHAPVSSAIVFASTRKKKQYWNGNTLNSGIYYSS